MLRPVTDYDLAKLSENNSKVMAALSAASAMIATGKNDNNWQTLIDMAFDYAEANSDFLNDVM